MTHEEIAKICHEVNRACCQAFDDNSQVPWKDAPQWQRDAALAGVVEVLQDPDLTPTKLHQAWMTKKLVDGWRHGEVKDPAKKEHPDLRLFSQLPPEKRVKDHLFLAVVRALAPYCSQPIPEENYP